MSADAKDRGFRKSPLGSAGAGSDLRRLNGTSARPAAPHGAGTTGDLFAWGARQKRYRRTGSLSVRQNGRSPGAYGIERSTGSARRARKLGTVLYSGSFAPSAPQARMGHDVQRNRVVFLVLVTLLAGFVVYRLVVD